MSGAATLVASSVSTQFLLSTSARPDPHTWTVTTQASLQIALALAVCSVIGTVIGWYAGARAPSLTPRTAGVLLGVASALFVIVAGIVTAVALMPDLWMVLWTVPIPAAVGGAAAGVSLWRSRRDSAFVPSAADVAGVPLRAMNYGSGARPGYRLPPALSQPQVRAAAGAVGVAALVEPASEADRTA